MPGARHDRRLDTVIPGIQYRDGVALQYVSPRIYCATHGITEVGSFGRHIYDWSISQKFRNITLYHILAQLQVLSFVGLGRHGAP